MALPENYQGYQAGAYPDGTLGVPPMPEHPLLDQIRSLIQERDELRVRIAILEGQMKNGMEIIAQAQASQPTTMATTNARY